jgi:hypothetical protein
MRSQPLIVTMPEPIPAIVTKQFLPSGRFAPGNNIVKMRGKGIVAQVKHIAREQMTPERIERGVAALLNHWEQGDLQAGIMLFGKAAMEHGLGRFDEEEATDEAGVRATLVHTLRKRLGVKQDQAPSPEQESGSGI